MGDGVNNFQADYVRPSTKDELIEDHYGWRWNEGTHGLIQTTFGAATAGLLAIGYMAM